MSKDGGWKWGRVFYAWEHSGACTYVLGENLSRYALFLGHFKCSCLGLLRVLLTCIRLACLCSFEVDHLVFFNIGPIVCVCVCVCVRVHACARPRACLWLF